MNIVVKSDENELYNVLDTINEFLDSKNVSEKFKLRLSMVLEEIFINIVNYAYEAGSEDNEIKIEYNFEKDPLKIIIKFIDKGASFNPLSNDDPDISLSSDEREIGGLGILLIKKSVDKISYQFKDNQNILTIEKNIKDE
ncbi:MAG: ATP-binding protein [Methanobrevibacter sp.]|nr:ATP-binding protein [Candidatus Methanovirga basalitermitum]